MYLEELVFETREDLHKFVKSNHLNFNSEWGKRTLFQVEIEQEGSYFDLSTNPFVVKSRYEKTARVLVGSKKLAWIFLETRESHQLNNVDPVVEIETITLGGYNYDWALSKVEDLLVKSVMKCLIPNDLINYLEWALRLDSIQKGVSYSDDEYLNSHHLMMTTAIMRTQNMLKYVKSTNRH